MSTFVLTQVPDANISAAVTANELALVWMNNNIVHGDSMGVVALNTGGASIPDLDSAIFGAGDHPLTLTVEGYAGDVATMAFEGENGVGV